MRIKPECRYCGTRVEFFGDICPECEGDGGITVIALMDQRRLAERGDD